MNLKLGIKSDPVEYRYTYDWLFDLLEELDVRYMQLGSFFELYSLEDGYFLNLREKAEQRSIRIKSCFTTHRELGGFFSGDPYLEKVARKNYEKYIHVASVLGADYMGSNPGFVYRDEMHRKQKGIDCYLKHMKELMVLAKEKGLKGLTMEPMSCHAEPPSLPAEIDYMLGELARYHEAHQDSTVPTFLCGDISHGVADENGKVLYDNFYLFEYGIPYMAEFHFKNTDAMFNSTFGFSPQETAKGIVDVKRLVDTVKKNTASWPVEEVVGYFETSGPKLGRDYTDRELRKVLVDSLTSLKAFI